MKSKQEELKTINLRNYFKSLANIWTYRMRIVITLLLILFSTHAMADLVGIMKCEVKSNDVITTKEGKPQKFIGYEDKFVVGDKLTITYEKMYSTFSVEMNDPVRDDHFMTASISGDDQDRSFHKPKYSEGILLRSKGFSNPRFIISSTEFENSIFANSEIISASNNLKSLELRRYYKNDWEGLYFSKFNLELQIAILDCRHTSDSLDIFIEKLHFEHEKYEQKKLLDEAKRLQERMKEAKDRQLKALQEK
jgi:hypothetical protein